MVFHSLIVVSKKSPNWFTNNENVPNLSSFINSQFSNMVSSHVVIKPHLTNRFGFCLNGRECENCSVVFNIRSWSTQVQKVSKEKTALVKIKDIYTIPLSLLWETSLNPKICSETN